MPPGVIEGGKREEREVMIGDRLTVELFIEMHFVHIKALTPF